MVFENFLFAAEEINEAPLAKTLYGYINIFSIPTIIVNLLKEERLTGSRSYHNWVFSV